MYLQQINQYQSQQQQQQQQQQQLISNQQQNAQNTFAMVNETHFDVTTNRLSQFNANNQMPLDSNFFLLNQTSGYNQISSHHHNNQSPSKILFSLNSS